MFLTLIIQLRMHTYITILTMWAWHTYGLQIIKYTPNLFYRKQFLKNTSIITGVAHCVNCLSHIGIYKDNREKKRSGSWHVIENLILEWIFFPNHMLWRINKSHCPLPGMLAYLVWCFQITLKGTLIKGIVF